MQYLLPLNNDELGTLMAVISSALTAIDTTAYSNKVQRSLAMSYKPHLESIRNKIKATKRR